MAIANLKTKTLSAIQCFDQELLFISALRQGDGRKIRLSKSPSEEPWPLPVQRFCRYGVTGSPKEPYTCYSDCCFYREKQRERADQNCEAALERNNLVSCYIVSAKYDSTS